MANARGTSSGPLARVTDAPTSEVLRVALDRLARAERRIAELESKALQSGKQFTEGSGQRITDVADPLNPQDVVTKAFLQKFVSGQIAVLSHTTQAGGGEGGGPGGGNGGGGGTLPVPLPNLLALVVEYNNANPGQIDTAHLDFVFMDGVVAFMRQTDERVGYLAKRANQSDISHESIAYYGGLGTPSTGSKEVWVVDIILGAGGPNPTPSWQNFGTGTTPPFAAWRFPR